MMKLRELTAELQKIVSDHPEAAEYEVLSTGGTCQYPQTGYCQYYPLKHRGPVVKATRVRKLQTIVILMEDIEEFERRRTAT